MERAADIRWSIEEGKKKKRPATDDQLAILEAGEPGGEFAADDWGIGFMCDAYIELSTNRALGYGGVGPIPAWSIREWCEDYELSVENARHFRTVIRLVDAETLRRQSADAKLRNKTPARDRE